MLNKRVLFTGSPLIFMINRRSLFAYGICYVLFSSLSSCTSKSLEGVKSISNGSATLSLKGDGLTNQTLSFQKAIDSCAAAGGGVIDVPAGTYLLSPITLRSNITLKLEAGAVLLASSNPADYKGDLSNFINADSVSNVTITGSGVIDGNGSSWWNKHITKKPRLVYITNGIYINMSGITLRNSPSFHFVPRMCQYVNIEGVTVSSPSNSPNTDGIDPSNCKHVQISDCHFDTGDDDIAIKSGRYKGQLVPASRDIQISNCVFLHGHGLSIGSETSSGVYDVTVSNCIFKGTTNGLRIKSEKGLGGPVGNVSYSDISMTNVVNPIIINLNYNLNSNNGFLTDVPSVKNVYYNRISFTGSDNAGNLSGLNNNLINGLSLENVEGSAKTGMLIQYAQNVILTNCLIHPSKGNPIITHYVSGSGF